MKKMIKLPNEETIGYLKSGTGEESILLIHGNMSTSTHWDTVMANIPEEEYTVYALDLPGFGVSSYNKSYSSLKEFAQTVKLFMDTVGIKKTNVVGWSTGGGIAMYLAIDYPESVEKLVLVESVGISGYPIFKKDANFQPVLGEFLKTKEEIAVDPIQVLPVLNAYNTKDRAFIKTLWNSAIYIFNQPEEERYEKYIDETLTQKNLVDIDYSLVYFNISHEHNGVVEGTGEVDKIEAPTLVIQGKNDIVVPVSMGEGIAKGIGENAELALLDNGGHAPMEDNLERFMNLVLEFLAK